MKPTYEPGAEGKPQAVLPGAERRYRGALQFWAEAPLRANVEQKACDVGLFSDERNQIDMFTASGMAPLAKPAR